MVQYQQLEGRFEQYSETQKKEVLRSTRSRVLRINEINVDSQMDFERCFIRSWLPARTVHSLERPKCLESYIQISATAAAGFEACLMHTVLSTLVASAFSTSGQSRRSGTAVLDDVSQDFAPSIQTLMLDHACAHGTVKGIVSSDCQLRVRISKVEKSQLFRRGGEPCTRWVSV